MRNVNECSSVTPRFFMLCMVPKFVRTFSPYYKPIQTRIVQKVIRESKGLINTEKFLPFELVDFGHAQRIF